MPISLGTAKASPGKITYGVYDFVAHPTGGRDQLPVIIAQGDPHGPVFWLTSGIHGPEHAGLQVIHLLLTRELAQHLHGTLISIPALSPAGLLTRQREPYYHTGDPNRLFPDGRAPQPTDPDDDPPSTLEVAYTHLFDELKASANYMVDLHNAGNGSLSFVFRDRVFYRNDQSVKKNQAARRIAEKLDMQLGEMCAAYGHSVVNELPPAKYLAAKLHRSTTAAAVNVAHIPALTMELGTGLMPDPNYVRAAVIGLKNVLRWAGMLPGEREPLIGVKVVEPGYLCRRRRTPRVSQPCIVRHLVEAGDQVKVGDPVAEIRDIWGRLSGEKILRSEYEGWIIGRSQGIVYYPGHEVVSMAIRDDLPTVMPYPADFFKA